jgi:hypothetical protein
MELQRTGYENRFSNIYLCRSQKCWDIYIRTWVQILQSLIDGNLISYSDWLKDLYLRTYIHIPTKKAILQIKLNFILTFLNKVWYLVFAHLNLILEVEFIRYISYLAELIFSNMFYIFFNVHFHLYVHLYD